MSEPYYITTAISYPNGRPHIGHAYEAIAADVIARFHRQMGRDVRFQTGTDEHGLKMAQKARELGQTPRELSDEMSSYFMQMCEKLNISHDRFIRTVEDEHHKASQAIWKAMEANGDLYLDRYEGWYSVRDEAYYDEKELIEGEGNEKLSPQGTPVEWTAEETWFFRLSKYQEPLLKLYNEKPNFLRPDSRRNEIMRFVEGGLNDLSVSRTSFDWGVKVPGSDGHVMYVWVDALTNYLTGLGYPEKTKNYNKFWPADLHLIGKDIVRFHSVYWPAFLMSAGIDLPKQVFGHGFLLNKGEKMSKSVGNVVDPVALAYAFGVDQIRYFLMREVNFGSDGSYSAKAIVTKTNADLANSFGNLVQRTLSMIFKNLDGAISADWKEGDADKALYETVSSACGTAFQHAFTDLDFSKALDGWVQAVFACNQYVDEQAPWKLKKEDPERMRAVLNNLFRCIRVLAIAVQPVIPNSAGKLLDQMGVAADARSFADVQDSDWLQQLADNGFTLEKPAPLFPRLEMPEGEEKA
ncbi:methionine--tRNA ligase [Sphingorhabdus sp. Alg239-R122]|uniref:methionine--tRNA ligase n=1 Tax=Sphingorhabdus sp. Alg239-R122 TaxID=2305989 RepID=UPI0013DA75B0|nr:methionine--tRNA ligase [Sphingorhabdus sp. Alg239-R122]